MREVTAFRKRLGDWLLSISGVSSLVGTRVYYGTPQTPVAFPCITFTMSRKPEGDYPGHAWACTVDVFLHTVSAADADALEDAIYQDLQSDAGDDSDVVDDLSGDGVRCVSFVLSEVGPDEAVLSFEDGSYVHMTRRLQFAASIVHAPE